MRLYEADIIKECEQNNFPNLGVIARAKPEAIQDFIDN